MTPNQQAWLAALRSGAYEQDKEFLRRENDGGIITYSVEGVACDISKLGNWTPFPKKPIYYYQIADEKNATVMPLAVHEYFELNSTGGQLFTLRLNHRNYNGDTFEQLADHIEKYLTGDRQC